MQDSKQFLDDIRKTQRESEEQFYAERPDYWHFVLYDHETREIYQRSGFRSLLERQYGQLVAAGKIPVITYTCYKKGLNP